MTKYLDFLLDLTFKEIRGELTIEEFTILSEIKKRAKKINDLEDRGVPFDKAEEEVNKDLV